MTDPSNLVNGVIECELCVVGAGIAGLNALHSASCYLTPNDKVLLVDSRAEPGGMWQDTYDYVRLHQPHPSFTVGNIPWKKKMPRDYLANKGEVNEQFQHCLTELAKRIDLQTLFAHDYVNHQEMADGVLVDISHQSSGLPIKVRAKRLIKAFGYNIWPSAALPLTSSQVHSVSIQDAAFAGEQMMASDAPIFIVGGGKSAMDTCHQLVKLAPGRDIRMLVGEGVQFANRNILYKQGLSRWFGGAVGFEWLLDVAMHFNGVEVQETNRFFLQKYGLSLSSDPKQFQVGVLSQEEFSVIQNGLSSVVEDYLDDVVDTAAGVELRYRSGHSEMVPVDSWFVNCTGYVARERQPYEPYVSESGRVLSINTCSGVFFLTSFSGYYLPHLMYRDEILSVPLYAGDMAEIAQQCKPAIGGIALSLAVLNVLILMKHLPTKIFNDCLLDINRMYPLPRRLPILLRFMINNAKYQAQIRKEFAKFSEQTGIAIGSLPHVG